MSTKESVPVKENKLTRAFSNPDLRNKQKFAFSRKLLSESNIKSLVPSELKSNNSRD